MLSISSTCKQRWTDTHMKHTLRNWIRISRMKTKELKHITTKSQIIHTERQWCQCSWGKCICPVSGLQLSNGVAIARWSTLIVTKAVVVDNGEQFVNRRWNVVPVLVLVSHTATRLAMSRLFVIILSFVVLNSSIHHSNETLLSD